MSEKTDEQKNEEIRANAENIMQKLASLMEGAKHDGLDERQAFTRPIEVTKNALVTRPSDAQTLKTLTAITTDTFLDTMFLDQTDKAINGVPSGSNIMILGVPNTGKSLLLSELALKFANSGKKVILATSEDAWRTNSARLDLESRYREKAKLLGLDWQKLSANLTILDLISHAELRDWDNFVSTLRAVVESEKAEIFLCDSVTLLEDNRSSIKFRLNEICRYGQNHGLTEIFVSQRATDDPDSFSVAGNLGLIHIVDIVVELDQKKLSSWDKNIKEDTGIAQGQAANFFRVLKCRMCKYRANYFAYEITKDGLVRLSMVKTSEPLNRTEK